MVNDPVGDFIIQLKNSAMVGKEEVTIPYSKFKHAIAEKLKERGFIKSVEKHGKKVHKHLNVKLTYFKNGTSRISHVSRISKPGRRIYRKVTEVYPIRHRKGIIILSTPKGILTGEEARKEKVGGEALFEMW